MDYSRRSNSCNTTGVGQASVLPRERLGELRAAGSVISEDAVTQAPVLTNKAGVELQLGDIETEHVRVLNDADMQWLAVIAGQGVEMVITLGTGFGSALFKDGQLGPHLELSQHQFRKGETYNEQLGNATLKQIGKRKWNRRVRRAIAALRALTNFDRLYIGGGNAAKIDFKLAPDVETIPNKDGLKGGAWLWRERNEIG